MVCGPLAAIAAVFFCVHQPTPYDQTMCIYQTINCNTKQAHRNSHKSRRESQSEQQQPVNRLVTVNLLVAAVVIRRCYKTRSASILYYKLQPTRVVWLDGENCLQYMYMFDNINFSLHNTRETECCNKSLDIQYLSSLITNIEYCTVCWFRCASNRHRVLCTLC